MSWLRRLSRDRSSKYDPDFSPPVSSEPKVSDIDTKHEPATKDSQFPITPITPTSPNDKMSRRFPKEQRNFSSPPQVPSSDEDTMHTAPPTLAAAPDPLTRAFNEALKPYHDQIALLQEDLNNATTQIQALEAEKAALYNWIDDRGYRADLPSDIASLAPHSDLAASTLASQLERKMTMVNYSLHHLGDSLPAPLPASTITNTFSALLPKISYLSTLPSGPPSAFEAIVKVAGNINSHHTGKETEADRANIAEFYSDLDDLLVDVINKRVVAVADGEESWDVSRDVKRLQSTGQFLKKDLGLRNYFLRSIEVMRGEGKLRAEESMTRYSDE